MSRETDIAIGRDVIGWDDMWFYCPKCHGTWFGSEMGEDGEIVARHCHDEHGRMCAWSGSKEDATPPYSSEIQYAWLVVEKMREIGGHVFNEFVDELCSQNFDGDGMRDFLPCLSANEAAERICLAALEAVA